MATGHLIPEILFSDMDGAIIAAAALELEDAFHCLCYWHLSRAITQQLGADALAGFWAVVFSPSEHEFDLRWRAWSASFPSQSAQSYISGLHAKSHMFALYKVVQHRLFTAGISSTQRVESQNAALKRVLSSRSNLSQVVQELVNHQLDQLAVCVCFHSRFHAFSFLSVSESSCYCIVFVHACVQRYEDVQQSIEVLPRISVLPNLQDCLNRIVSYITKHARSMLEAECIKAARYVVSEENNFNSGILLCVLAFLRISLFSGVSSFS
jgi:hypothetical protein